MAQVGQRQRRPFKTTAGQELGDVELQLTRGGTVRGQVLNSKGKPKPHIGVRAVRMDLLDNRYYVPTTKTDDDGRFELKFIQPGRQHIQGGEFWTPPNVQADGSAQIVNIEPGATIEDMKLIDKQ